MFIHTQQMCLEKLALIAKSFLCYFEILKLGQMGKIFCYYLYSMVLWICISV